MINRDEVKRALDRRLQDIKCAVWGRNFQLHNEEDRDRAIEFILGTLEPALEKAGLVIVPKNTTAYIWQADRGLSEKDTHTAGQFSEVDSTNGATRENRLFQNGIC